MNLLRHASLIPVLAALPLAAGSAQELLDEEAPEIRRYTVEMIVFRYAQDVGVGTEIFVGDEIPLDESLPVDEGILLSTGPADQPDADSEDDPVVLRDIEFVPLARDDFTMGEIMGHLRRLDVYEPVMHFGWTQATWPEEETRAIELASLALPPRGLDGTLKLYLSRFLHLVVDLELDGPATPMNDPRPDGPYSDFSDVGRTERLGSFAPRRGPVRYRIEEDRIFRSGELRYFDHPKFGVLARVTRVEEAEDGTGENELLGYPPE